VGSVQSLHATFAEAVLQEGVPLEAALRAITANPARIFKEKDRGRLAVGCMADLVFLDAANLAVHTVLAAGRTLMENGVACVRGNYE
jgi:beta-aspartyl-dipeptidase (metallo-type)